MLFLGCGYFPLLSNLSPEYVLHSDDFFVSNKNLPIVYDSFVHATGNEGVIVLDSSVKSATISRELLYKGMYGTNKIIINGERFVFPNFDWPGVIYEGKIYFAIHHNWKNMGNQTDSIFVCQIDFNNQSLNRIY